jgi:pimeloyl-ACP methyl ester carboxylesterase
MIPTSVTSSHGVRLALHDLAPGHEGPLLLLSHATGFHGHCYQPMADLLSDYWHPVALDYRGHGDSDGHPGDVDWQHYGDDAETVARALGGGLPAFGHSMGGACLLMAAHRDPSLFTELVVFEPIVFPPEGIRPGGGGEPSPMVQGALRRRASFPSYESAVAHYAGKPPLNAFTPAALEAYVRYGFRPGDDGEVHLKCRPETEAGTFATGGLHTTWDVLPEIETSVLVIAGHTQVMQPSAVSAAIAERLPNGRYLQLDHLDHFGPMSHPDEIAGLVLGALA